MITACSLTFQTIKTYMATGLIQAIADTFKQLVCSNAMIEYTLKIFNQARQNRV